MSVMAFISETNNKADEKFSIPVASEQFFEKCWLPAIHELNLEFLSQIEYGLEFQQSELPVIIEELNEVLSWTQDNLYGDDKSLIDERVKLLIEKLPEAFSDSSNKVYIG